MSEHIKTEKEIVEEGLKRFNESESFQQLLEWVLIEQRKNIYSWLKEQIWKHNASINFDNDNDFVLSLLEE